MSDDTGAGKEHTCLPPAALNKWVCQIEEMHRLLSSSIRIKRSFFSICLFSVYLLEVGRKLSERAQTAARSRV